MSPFTNALKKGLGRAMLMLRADPGNAALHAELMHACKVNLVYDPQCEDGRAPYLCRLITEAGQGRTYWDTLLGELAKGNKDAHPRDRIQMFEVLCQLAATDATLDRTALQQFIDESDFDETSMSCMEPYVALQGIDGLVFCFRKFAHVIGQRKWNEDWHFHHLMDTLAERDGPDAAMSQICRARSLDSELDRLLRLIEVDDAPDCLEETKLDRAAIADRVGRHSPIPWAWRRDASADDLEWVADRLLGATDDKQVWRYLQMFMKRPFPRPPEKIFHLVRSKNARVAYTVALVLGQINHPGVRSLALELVAGNERPRLAVQLLVNNFCTGDFALIEQLLSKFEFNEDNYHDLSSGVFDVISKQPQPIQESRASLLHLYEHEPCSLCRERAVSKLVALGDVPGWIVEECQLDAVAATAVHVRA